ncbi:MAG: bla regulator protein BlaR1 [Patiriisocius sp.]|jgi:hypothetical protein
MVHYIFQLLTFQLLFLAVYDLFLKKETFFQYNRVYLLCTSILSITLPLLKINVLRQAIPTEFLVQLPTVVIGDRVALEMAVGQQAVPSQELFSMASLFSSLQVLWFIGMGIASLLLAYKVYTIWTLRRTGRTEKIEGVSLVVLPNTDMAFSFLKTMYIGEELSEKQQRDIVLHEQVHIQQRHTFDLLFFELFKIVCWFNPLVYIYQKRMEALHEYIADQSVAKRTQNLSYYQTLLAQVFQTESISFINTFFNHSLIKKRIIMLQKSKSNRLSQLKYLVLVPLVFSMLVYTSCSNDADLAASETANLSSDTEVMEKIVALSEAIMKKGNISDEEVKALKFLAIEAKPGDKIYTSIQEYLDDPDSEYNDYEVQVIEEGLPVTLVDRVPVYPGCNPLTDNEELKKCMQGAINAHILNNFDLKVAENLGLTGTLKMFVQFKVNKTGQVVDVKARAPLQELQDEAIRVIKAMPKMIPGEHDAKPVSVMYSQPIAFKVNE